MSGLTHATGVSLTARDRWNFGANTEIGTLIDSMTGAKTERQAGGIRVGYALDQVQLSSGVEYRSDDAQQPDATEHPARHVAVPEQLQVSALGRLARGRQAQSFDERELAGAVLRWRLHRSRGRLRLSPVFNDRLDVLAKYTYFYNVPTTDQMTLQSLAAQYIQKSNVASLDVTYDLTSRWTLGGKYAYRVGQMSLTREQPEFFDNTAMLYIVRADYRIGENWEGMIEARMLDLPDFSDRRGGALIGVYRYVGEHVKVGVGYNFTDFSEDLTDLSFRHHGVFMNVVGSM